MGAWGVGTFENDTACDYALEVAEGSNLARLESPIDHVLASGNAYLEAPQAEEALAAAEINARLMGRFGKHDAYTEKIDEWVGRVGLSPSDELAEKARRCVARVMTQPSALLDLWTESDQFASWQSSVEELLRRLQGGRA